jgi:uncharacterized protein YndB with AHSA1/START domain
MKEEKTMSETMTDVSTFMYVTYITATPQKVWEALTSPDFTEKFWFGWRVQSEWRVGGKVVLEGPKKSGMPDVEGKLLECDPPNRLVYTWHEGGASGKENPSRLAFDLKQMGKTVRLTVTHENLSPEDVEANPNTFKGVNNGWPAVLNSLKSLLETGQELSFA